MMGMIARRASDSEMAAMFKKIIDWFTLGDYEVAKRAATNRIIKKQSRGSVFAQNGWYMTQERLTKASREADSHIKHVRKALQLAR